MSPEDKAFLQAVVDRGVPAVIAQGEASVDEKGDCLYRSPKGLKCLIGHCIHDDHFEEGFESSTPQVDPGIVVAIELTVGLKALQLDIIGCVFDKLQETHDKASVEDPETFVDHFARRASEFCDDYGLTKPPALLEQLEATS